MLKGVATSVTPVPVRLYLVATTIASKVTSLTPTMSFVLDSWSSLASRRHDQPEPIHIDPQNLNSKKVRDRSIFTPHANICYRPQPGLKGGYNSYVNTVESYARVWLPVSNSSGNIDLALRPTTVIFELGFCLLHDFMKYPIFCIVKKPENHPELVENCRCISWKLLGIHWVHVSASCKILQY